MNDWNIQTRARACQSCERAFADQETYHTLLFEHRATFERQDVCGRCWDEQHRHGSADRKGFISHWQGTFSLPPPAPPDPIQRDSAEMLLRRLTERNDPAWGPAAFILAVMLERKRILKNREQFHQEGRRTFVYELPRTGELFTVPDPDLHLDQLEQVQRDVARLLERGLSDPQPPPETNQPSPPVTHTQPIDPSTSPPPEANPVQPEMETASTRAGSHSERFPDRPDGACAGGTA